MTSEKYDKKSIGKSFQYLGVDPHTRNDVYFELETARIYRLSRRGVFVPIKVNGIESKLFEVKR